MNPTVRKVLVLGSLVALLGMTSALLVALAPPPLAAEQYNTLSATGGDPLTNAIFQTTVAPRQDHWKFIFIHQSGASSGDAQSLVIPGVGLPDHFVIGNGHGCPDGEIQIGPRWESQQSPAAPAGVQDIDPDCISICLIGNLDRAGPTATQLQTLSQLVAALQTQWQIGSDKIVLLDQPNSPAGAGRQFPTGDFRKAILP